MMMVIVIIIIIVIIIVIIIILITVIVIFILLIIVIVIIWAHRVRHSTQISWSKTWIISRYANRLDCCDKLMTRVQTHDVGDAICENVLQIVDIGAPKPEFWKGSRSASIRRRIGKWSASCWDPREWASMLIPELKNPKDCLRKWTSWRKSCSNSGPETPSFVTMF